MRVRLSGVDYFNNREISNEVFLWKLWVRKWEPELPNPDFVEEDGGGNDGDDGFQDDDQEDPISDDCPEGFVFDPDVGACVPIEEQEEEGDNEDDDSTEDREVSTGAVVLTVAAIGLIIVFALRGV
jgi:hypothetical protein